MGKLNEKERLFISDRYFEAANSARQAADGTNTNYAKQNFERQATLLALVGKAVLAPEMYLRWMRLKAAKQLTSDAYSIEEKLITTGTSDENRVSEEKVIELLMEVAAELLDNTGEGGEPI